MRLQILISFFLILLKSELQECEAIIERGLKTFVEVGEALATIRDKKLYRKSYDTFEDYCQDRWGISRNYVKRLINASGTIDNLKNVPIGTLPQNEAQARPLTQLEPRQQVEAWQSALDSTNGNPTAKDVKEAVERVKKRETVKEDIKTVSPRKANQVLSFILLAAMKAIQSLLPVP